MKSKKTSIKQRVRAPLRPVVDTIRIDIKVCLSALRRIVADCKALPVEELHDLRGDLKVAERCVAVIIAGKEYRPRMDPKTARSLKMLRADIRDAKARQKM